MAELTTYHVKLARPQDAPLLARMSRDYIEQGLPWRWNTARIRAKILAPETVVLVAELRLAGQRYIGGFAVMDFDLDSAQLNLLAVHPRLRRSGVGSRLLRWLHKSASTAGCQQITLQVRADNQTAMRFYRSHGYQEETLIPGYYEGLEAAYQLKLRLLQA